MKLNDLIEIIRDECPVSINIRDTNIYGPVGDVKRIIAGCSDIIVKDVTTDEGEPCIEINIIVEDDLT